MPLNSSLSREFGETSLSERDNTILIVWNY